MAHEENNEGREARAAGEKGTGYSTAQKPTPELLIDEQEMLE